MTYAKVQPKVRGSIKEEPINSNGDSDEDLSDGDERDIQGHHFIIRNNQEFMMHRNQPPQQTFYREQTDDDEDESRGQVFAGGSLTMHQSEDEGGYQDSE